MKPLVAATAFRHSSVSLQIKQMRSPGPLPMKVCRQFKQDRAFRRGRLIALIFVFDTGCGGWASDALSIR
jgi:hypothetical protein